MRRKKKATEAQIAAGRARIDAIMSEWRAYVPQSRILADRDADKPVPASGGYDGARYAWCPPIRGVALTDRNPVVYREHTDPLATPLRFYPGGPRAEQVQAHSLMTGHEPCACSVCSTLIVGVSASS